MRAVIQRVTRASVAVDGQTVSRIGRGLLVFVGVEQGDGPQDVRYVAEKTVGLRIFEDGAGKMNRSALDAGGDLLVVSQFTLLGDVRRGRRPSFVSAAPPEIARNLYADLCSALRELGANVEEGVFQADMQVELVNDGPVTILLDSRRLF
ncbi:MAG: D-tyrosyl-tRNA(Tyr) deacylase [Planctomycetota bacterium]|nr:MAG: D-tyrosyl-tRNA(Tyr) deacylase [Planctomycetota bacterium]